MERRRTQACGKSRGGSGHAAQPVRERFRSSPRCAQHGHGAGTLLRSAGGAGRACGPFHALRARVAAGGCGQPPPGREIGGARCPRGSGRRRTSCPAGQRRTRNGAHLFRLYKPQVLRCRRQLPRKFRPQLSCERHRPGRPQPALGSAAGSAHLATLPPNCCPTAICSLRWPAPPLP